MDSTTIPELFRACVERRPDRVAYVFGGQRLTWRETDRLVATVAGALAARGVTAGTRVASLMHDGLVHTALYFAIAELGAVRVGVNHRYSPGEVEELLEHSGAEVIVVEDALRGLVPASSSIATISCGDGADELGDLATAGPERNRLRLDVGEDQLAAICYTTGSTGVPKGAMWTHGNVVHAMTHTAIEAGIEAADTWLHCLPGAGVPGLLGIWNSVSGWANVVLPSFDPDTCLDAIETEQVTATVWVPTMLGAVVAAQRERPRDVTSLRKIVYGSAPSTPALIRRTLETFPGVEIEQWYGSTEGTGGWFTRLSDEDHRRALSGHEHLLRSCGRPMHHARVVVRDGDRGLPAGENGEIWVSGDFVMEGYLDAPDLSDDTVDDGWLRTGDLGHLDDEGYVYLVDRQGFMIITGGYNVYPVEVENVLAEHPAVHEVCVFGVPDETWGEAVKALVVLRKGAAATAEELREHCRGQLASFKIPKSVEIRPELKKGPTGKILKRFHRDEYR